MFLGVEIGGTKLQLGVGPGNGQLEALERFEVEPIRGASGILERIELAAQRLVETHQVEAIGIGFGGPCNTATGYTIKSHQISGWDDFPLVEWAERVLSRPTTIGNDADVAGLAEAFLGAGHDRDPVFYVTVGTGIGGGLIVGRTIYRGRGLGAAEIGHLRPGLAAENEHHTVESLAAGPGIAANVQARLTALTERFARDNESRGERFAPFSSNSDAAARDDLLARCGGDLSQLTTKHIGAAAVAGNPIASDAFQTATDVLGWAIAQVITITAPEVVVVGGGVSLVGERLFFGPLRRAVERYVFPPFRGTYQVLPAELGEEVVVHGALALAKSITTAG